MEEEECGKGNEEGRESLRDDVEGGDKKWGKVGGVTIEGQYQVKLCYK